MIARRRLSELLQRPVRRRKEAEACLQRMENRLSMVVNHIPVILCATDSYGIVMLFEGKGLQGLGMKPGEMVGRSIFDLYRDQPDAIAIVKRALAGEPLVTTVEMD